jgi:hypothetical protein
MAYYYDHQEEIDHHTAESRAWVEQMRQNNPPSPLQAKLNLISRSL